MSNAWPRVSQILTDLGLRKPVPDTPATRWGRARGTAVHRAIQLHAQDALDPTTLHDDVAGCFAAYLRFRKDHDCVLEGVEMPVFHTLLRYRGTLDAYGVVDANRVILDYKCGERADLDGATLQLAAYSMALDPPCHHGGWIVLLRPEGSYQVTKRHLSKAADLFTAAVTVWWAQREGL